MKEDFPLEPRKTDAENPRLAKFTFRTIDYSDRRLFQKLLPEEPAAAFQMEKDGFPVVPDMFRRHSEPDASAEAIDEPSPTRDGPELLVSYSSPGAPKRRDVPPAKQSRSWFEPAKITAVKQARRLEL